MFSQQLLTGSLLLNCQSVQYLPCTQSSKIVFSTLMGKNPRQKSLWTKLWLGFFLQEKSVFEQYPLDTRAADHCTPASSHLADAKCLGLSPMPEWIQLHHPPSCRRLADLSVGSCMHRRLPSMDTLLHGACSSALSALTAFKTILDTIGKVLGTPASSRPGKPSR